jgi:hypothetical protein
MEKFRKHFYTTDGDIKYDAESGFYSVTLLHGHHHVNGHMFIESDNLSDIKSLFDYMEIKSPFFENLATINN